VSVGTLTERKVVWIFSRSADKVVGPNHVYPPKRIFLLSCITNNKMAQPNHEDVTHLREEVMAYTAVDNRLRALNTEVYRLRDERSAVADRIIQIVRQPGFASISELSVSHDGSKIRIKKPQTWNACWSLSKSKLREYLQQHLGLQAGNMCFAYIDNTHSATLRKDTFDIERICGEQE